jgi:hypothetical protein
MRMINTIGTPIEKQDMISIVVNTSLDNTLEKRLLKIFWPEENKTWVLWVIQYEQLEDKVVISCIDWESRDELFDLLTETLTPSTQ